MASTKLLLLFHTQLKMDLCDRVGVVFYNTLRVQSMLPMTFFRAFIQHALKVGHIFEQGQFYQQQLLALFKRYDSNQSYTVLLLRQVQIILEYTILTYVHTHTNDAYRWMFATEFANIKDHHHILRKAFNEYFSASSIDIRHITIAEDGNLIESDNPLEMVLLSRVLYEQDLFNSLVRHISVSSVSKISQCKRDIYYWHILRGMTKDGWNNRRRLYIDQEPVTPFVAFAIRRLFEHIGYLKHSIYEIKLANIWGAILNKSPAYQRSFFCGLVDRKNQKRKMGKKCNYIIIQTAGNELGYLYLYDEKKRSDVYKEYAAVLAMMTTIQNPEAQESIIYCDSRLNHNLFEKSYDDPNQFPIHTNNQYTPESTTTAVNKLLSWAASEEYFPIKRESDKAAVEDRNVYEGKSNADDPACLNSDDYESCRILTESFVLEFLNWSSCQPPGLAVSQS